MKSIIIFFLAPNGRELTDRSGHKVTFSFEGGHNVVTFKSTYTEFVASDCTFLVKGGALVVSKRSGKPFLIVEQTGIWLPSIQ